MYCRLEIYVPETHAEAVKTAIFAAGAGRIGAYDRCAWQTLGAGQFRPLPGSRPFLGEINRVERTAEIKIETICPAAAMPEIIAALKKAHPYETPAFQYWPVAIE